MRFRVRHVTNYTFSRPVFLEPHTFRLAPRSDDSQTLLNYRITIDPEPVGRSSGTGVCGNREETAWFEGLTGHLRVEVSFEAATSRTNPFDFVIAGPWAWKVPTRMPDPQRSAFAPFLETGDLPPAVSDFAREVLREAGRETMPFLDSLNRSFRKRFRYVLREEGGPQPPGELLERGKGSCRDFALLFMTVCRSQGLPARFVSGYQEADPDSPEPRLHAWAEIYLPGGGWRGYDPTQGLLVADRHVAVAAGPSNLEAAPITGTFRGDGATVTMRARISVRTTPG